MHDVNILDMIPISKDKFNVMDRGYVDYAKLYRIHK